MRKQEIPMLFPVEDLKGRHRKLRKQEIPMQPVYAMLTGGPEYDIIKFDADTVYAHFGEKGYLRWQ